MFEPLQSCLSVNTSLPAWALPGGGGSVPVEAQLYESLSRETGEVARIYIKVALIVPDIMSNTSLIQRICSTQLSTPAQVLSKLLGCALPIAQVAIGSVYLHDCPRQYLIPIYLIVGGVFGFVLSMLPCTQDDSTNSSRICIIWNSLTSFFLLGWFIAGNVWIYSIYEPNYNKNTTNVDSYCNKTLYLFAFWSTTLVYILLGVSFLCGCLYCFYLCGRAEPDDDV
ncbi:transmembrane protein 272-like [Anabas testudineus]|uniref:Uncharacterized protein n=1 Tax=Anabas testudineus TaxID=64144 RepID=A0A3Q1I759_ANATE|nr:transmembrane protein 272-like [Anabas testudineus]